jgi:hypothetical protein
VGGSVKRAIGLILVAVLTASCGGATGEDAVKAMSPVEKQFLLDKVMKIEGQMTAAQVEAVLGKPARGEGTARPTWLGPEGGKWSQVAVYLLNDKVFKVRWMHMGKFTGDEELRVADHCITLRATRP